MLQNIHRDQKTKIRESYQCELELNILLNHIFILHRQGEKLKYVVMIFFFRINQLLSEMENWVKIKKTSE